MVMVAGCTSAPASIPVGSVSDEIYQTMNCLTLEKERARVLTTLDAASGEQQSKANRDAFAAGGGAIVHPIFYLALTSESAVAMEVSRLKAEYYALERALIAKKCAVPASR